MEDLLHAFDCGHFRFVQRPEVLHEGNVVLHLLHVAHAGEHHQHAGEARGKAQGVACRAAAVQRVQYGLRVLGQPDKIAALDRLHDDDGLVIFPADLIAGAALDGGIVVVRVVEPDLDGFDLRIVRQDLLEHLRAVMERDAHMADLALGLEGKGRFIGAAGLEMRIVARALRVHQVEVKILDAAGLELLLKQRADVRLGLEEVRRQFEVNLFGMARLIRLVTPAMREQHYEKIVNISSMGGKIWTKFGGWYHATKYAVEGLSDCLRMELQPFGIDVVVVEPGGIKTDRGLIAAENPKKTSTNGAYAEMANKAADDMIKNYSGDLLSKPALIAKTVRKAVTKRRPRTRYLVGFGAKPMVWTHRLFGDRVFDWVLRTFS